MLGPSVAARLAANVAYGARFGVTGALLSGGPAVAFIGSAEMAIGMARRTRQAVASDGPETEPAALSAPARSVQRPSCLYRPLRACQIPCLSRACTRR